MRYPDPAAMHHIWCAVPVFNNKETIRDIVAGCRSVLENVVVVDDGSTDTDIKTLLKDTDAVVLRHEKNLGKGSAILTASRYVEDQGGTYMITIDADGQHNPGDIEKFIPFLHKSEPALVIGCRNFDTAHVPRGSRFGRKFANFWLRMETGIYISDCQSGFRAYPVKYINRMKFSGSHYDFEAEVLAKAAWAGLDLVSVDVGVHYPVPEERVSHFRPVLDNMRISLVHTLLIIRRLLPVKHRRLVEKKKTDYRTMLHPGRLLKTLLMESATPAELGMSAAVGIFLAVLPLLFVHTIVILYVAARLNLNKIVAVNVQHLCAPPFVPAICIEVGFYLRNGHWLTDISFETVFAQFSDRLIEWLLGSLVIAPVGAVLIGCVTFFASGLIRKRMQRA